MPCPCTRFPSAVQGLSHLVVRVRPIGSIAAAGHHRQDLPENLIGNIFLIRHQPSVPVSAGLRRLGVVIKSAGLRSCHPKLAINKSMKSSTHTLRGWPPWPIVSSIGANLN